MGVPAVEAFCVVFDFLWHFSGSVHAPRWFGRPVVPPQAMSFAPDDCTQFHQEYGEQHAEVGSAHQPLPMGSTYVQAVRGHLYSDFRTAAERQRVLEDGRSVTDEAFADIKKRYPEAHYAVEVSRSQFALVTEIAESPVVSCIIQRLQSVIGTQTIAFEPPGQGRVFASSVHETLAANYRAFNRSLIFAFAVYGLALVTLVPESSTLAVPRVIDEIELYTIVVIFRQHKDVVFDVLLGGVRQTDIHVVVASHPSYRGLLRSGVARLIPAFVHWTAAQRLVSTSITNVVYPIHRLRSETGRPRGRQRPVVDEKHSFDRVSRAANLVRGFQQTSDRHCADYTDAQMDQVIQDAISSTIVEKEQQALRAPVRERMLRSGMRMYQAPPNMSWESAEAPLSPEYATSAYCHFYKCANAVLGARTSRGVIALIPSMTNAVIRSVVRADNFVWRKVYDTATLVTRIMQRHAAGSTEDAQDIAKTEAELLLFEQAFPQAPIDPAVIRLRQTKFVIPPDTKQVRLVEEQREPRPRTESRGGGSQGAVVFRWSAVHRTDGASSMVPTFATTPLLEDICANGTWSLGGPDNKQILSCPATHVFKLQLYPSKRTIGIAAVNIVGDVSGDSFCVVLEMKLIDETYALYAAVTWLQLLGKRNIGHCFVLGSSVPPQAVEQLKHAPWTDAAGHSRGFVWKVPRTESGARKRRRVPMEGFRSELANIQFKRQCPGDEDEASALVGCIQAYIQSRGSGEFDITKKLFGRFKQGVKAMLFLRGSQTTVGADVDPPNAVDHLGKVAIEYIDDM